MMVVVALLSGAIGVLVCWLIIKYRMTLPGSAAAQKEIEKVIAVAQGEAQQQAMEIKNAPADDIADRINKLRERGHSGK